MTSKITFSNIKYTLVKSSSDITNTERRSGKLYARSIINRLAPGLRIDVLVLKTLPVFICDEPFTVNENGIRAGTKRCFEKLSKSYSDAGKLPVKTDFFKKIKDGDTIVIILHEVEP